MENQGDPVRVDTVTPDAAPQPDRGERFDRRAGLLLAVLVMVGVAVVLLVGLGSSDSPLVVRVVYGLGVVILAVAYLATIRGLAVGRSWARGVARILLVLVILLGVLEITSGLATNRITFPFAAIAAFGIVGAARGVSFTIPPDGRRVAAVVVLIALVGTLWPPIASWLLTPGRSPLAVGQDAIVMSVDLDCAATDDDGSPLAAVTTTWHWRSRDLFPGSTDGLLIDWTAAEDGVVLWTVDPLPAGVWQGGGSPASTLLQPRADGTSWEFGIDVQRGGQIDGRVRLTLKPSRPNAPVMVGVRSDYAHLDRWVVSAMPVDGCEVPAGPAS